MLSEIRSNGTTQIRLTGERPIEIQAIDEILNATGKGQTLKVMSDMGEDKRWVLILSVEHGV